MADFLEIIKEKYSEELGWSFSFFEGVVFLIFLIVTYEILNGAKSGVWKTLLLKNASSIFSGEESILANARILDYLISALLTIAVVYGYRKIRCWIYKYLSTLHNFEEYILRLKKQYSSNNVNNQALRIYIANEAKEHKDIYMKRISSINGFGLIFLAIVVSSVFGLFIFNWADFGMLIIGIVGILIVQWQVFSLYSSQVVPRLVLERVARGESVDFGDELQ